jgi:type IV secretion system protein VirB10
VSEHDALPGERHADVPAQRRINRRHGAVMIGLAGVCVAGYFAFHPSGQDKRDSADDRPRTISQLAAFEPAKVEKANMQTPLAAPVPPMKQALVQEQAAPDDPLTKARIAPLVLGLSPQGQRPVEVIPAAATPGTGGESESELASKLHATILEGTRATVLRHPQFMVTMGTLIPCTLLTAMDSSAPGIVTCVTQQDVLGSTGSVVLMERGTKMVGEYSSHMMQGQSRMFVLWNRAETPKHVVITLGSPGADALGRAGFDGWIDTHFWQRFGGALMLTFIDGAFSTATSLASKAAARR